MYRTRPDRGSIDLLTQPFRRDANAPKLRRRLSQRSRSRHRRLLRTGSRRRRGQVRTAPWRWRTSRQSSERTGSTRAAPGPARSSNPRHDAYDDYQHACGRTAAGACGWPGDRRTVAKLSGRSVAVVTTPPCRLAHASRHGAGRRDPARAENAVASRGRGSGSTCGQPARVDTGGCFSGGWCTLVGASATTERQRVAVGQCARASRTMAPTWSASMRNPSWP